MVGPVVTSQWPRCTVSFHKAPAKGGLPGESPASSTLQPYNLGEAVTATRVLGSRTRGGGRSPSRVGQDDSRLWETRPYMAGYQSPGCPEEDSIWGREGARALTSPAERSASENEPQGTFLSLLSATRMEKKRLKNHRDRQARDCGPMPGDLRGALETSVYLQISGT